MITYGGFSLNLGREAGIGYLHNKPDEDALYVLIRKVTSRFYYLATINKK